MRQRYDVNEICQQKMDIKYSMSNRNTLNSVLTVQYQIQTVHKRDEIKWGPKY